MSRQKWESERIVCEKRPLFFQPCQRKQIYCRLLARIPPGNIQDPTVSNGSTFLWQQKVAQNNFSNNHEGKLTSVFRGYILKLPFQYGVTYALPLLCHQRNVMVLQSCLVLISIWSGVPPMLNLAFPLWKWASVKRNLAVRHNNNWRSGFHICLRLLLHALLPHVVKANESLTEEYVWGNKHRGIFHYASNSVGGQDFTPNWMNIHRGDSDGTFEMRRGGWSEGKVKVNAWGGRGELLQECAQLSQW